MGAGFASDSPRSTRKEPWFRNHVCNGSELRWCFAGQVAISKSRFLSALDQHPRAEKDKDDAEGTGEGLVGKGAHQVAAEPCGEGGGEADSGDDFPIDEVARASIVRGGGEGGDDYDGERSGDRLFLPEA